MSEVINKWEELRFLDNVKNKRNVSLALEICQLYLLNEIEFIKLKTINNQIDTLAFPVIVNIFKNIENDLIFNLIVDKTIQIINEFSKLCDKKMNIENEGEIIKEYCDNFKIIY